MLALILAASSAWTVLDMERQCKGEYAIGTAEEQLVGCAAFVLGVMEGVQVSVDTLNARQVYCPEKPIVAEQAVRIFLKFTAANPELLQGNARTAIVLSLAQAFPCP